MVLIIVAGTTDVINYKLLNGKVPFRCRELPTLSVELAAYLTPLHSAPNGKLGRDITIRPRKSLLARHIRNKMCSL